MSAEAVKTIHQPALVAALQKASTATGSDFHYLLKTAIRESGLKADARSTTSSASGLFQFVEQTWLGMVKEYGPRHGLASYAAAITKGADGRYHAGGAERSAILSLRDDPQISALMAGEYAGQSKGRMEAVLGRAVRNEELYAAHFLGADSACRLIRLSETSPDASAAACFPKAAQANKTVFYHADGSAKTVREVYEWAANQPSTPSVAPMPAVPARFEYVPALANYENSLLVSALLSEPSSDGFFHSGGSNPFRLSAGLLDVLSAATGIADKDGDA